MGMGCEQGAGGGGIHYGTVKYRFTRLRLWRGDQGGVAGIQ